MNHQTSTSGDARTDAPPPNLDATSALPPEETDRLLGDTVTETLGSVLISLVGDRASPLADTLADLSIDDFVRSAIFDAWTAPAVLRIQVGEDLLHKGDLHIEIAGCAKPSGQSSQPSSPSGGLLRIKTLGEHAQRRPQSLHLAAFAAKGGPIAGGAQPQHRHRGAGHRRGGDRHRTIEGEDALSLIHIPEPTRPY